MIIFAQTILVNGLHDLIPVEAPSIDVTRVIAAGSNRDETRCFAESASRCVTDSENIDRIFYFTAGTCVASFCFSWFMGWVDIRKKSEKQGDETLKNGTTTV